MGFFSLLCKKMSLNPLTSKTINNLRLPLILGVVLIHSNYLHGALSHFLCSDFTRCCVPLFFFISGLLFFQGITDFSKKVYLKKLKSRTTTLLIPYLIWNFIFFILFSAKTVFSGEATLSYLVNNLQLAFIGRIPDNPANVLEPYTLPFDFPLWFIRDLYVYVLLSPVFYYLIKKLGPPLLIILTVAFLTGFWPQILFFSISGVLFFSMGAFIATRGYDIADMINKCPTLSRSICCVYPILVVLDTVAYTFWEDIFYYIHALQILTGFFAIFIVFCKITSRGLSIKVSGECVFAIYVMHAIFITYISAFVKHEHWFNAENAVGSLLYCLFCFVSTLVLSIVSFIVIKRMSPRLSSILFGKREIPLALKERK